ncbi:MAG: DUF4349 domain-containing protein [Acidobacteria bacterium]|nr:DUF4349 domain-containing protein [Acidobacteriota bacterium]MBU4306217.1 DUF4349 domain-containing protein [Acidobacteriota bacterium]MBU4404358.1 DUF4349 domain-containing protein [Acidobacteriota bacterium]MCG2811503.1 DUF4349 domain-containing protein [Candidatus Aminicenantes bacterium]
MKQKVLRVIRVFTLLFFIVFGLRLIYEFAFNHSDVMPALVSQFEQQVSSNDSQQSRTLNIASYKMSKNVIIKEGPVRTALDQKYEKIAHIQSRSREFAADEKRLRSLVQKEKGIIQSESNSGLPGYRSLYLTIGVPPQRFMPAVEQIKQIGTLQSIRITQTDKTTEYKNLLAKKASLEKAQTGLTALKNRNGSIDDLTKLETKILEIEASLQGMGVQLGVYNEENEFCTAQLSLAEIGLSKSSFLTILNRIMSALAWTAMFYACVMGILILVLIASLLLLWVIEKAKRLSVTP